MLYFIILTVLYKADIVFKGYSYHIVLLGIIYVLFNFFNSNLKSIYMVNEELFVSNRYKLFASVLKVAILFILYFKGYLNVNNFIILNILIFVLPVVLMCHRIKFKFFLSLDSKLIRNQLSYGFFLYLSALFIFLSYKVDQFMIRSFLGVAELGVYSVGVNLAELLFLIPRSIINPLRGKLFNLEGDRDYEKKALNVKTTKYTFFVCLLLILIGFAMTPLIPIVYGNEFTGAVLVVRILFIGVVFASIGKVSSNYFFTEGIPKIHLLVTFVVFISNIFMNMIFIPNYGINGAALASTISYFIYGAFYIAIYVKKGNIPIKDFFWISKKDIRDIKKIVIGFKKQSVGKWG